LYVASIGSLGKVGWGTVDVGCARKVLAQLLAHVVMAVAGTGGMVTEKLACGTFTFYCGRTFVVQSRRQEPVA
jgi:hypothetical protein